MVLGLHLVAVAADCGDSAAMSVNVTELHLSAFGAGEPPLTGLEAEYLDAALGLLPSNVNR